MIEFIWFVAVLSYLALGFVITHLCNIKSVKVTGGEIPFSARVGLIGGWVFIIPCLFLWAAIICIKERTIDKIPMHVLRIRRRDIREDQWVTKDLQNYVFASQNNDMDSFFEMAKTLGWKASERNPNILVKVVSKNEMVKLQRYQGED